VAYFFYSKGISALQKKKSSRLAWREKSSASDEEVGANDNVPDNGGAKLIKGSFLVKVEKIGDLNPVQDFEAMMARRDSSKWVKKAIKEMQDYIYNLLENSYEGNAYPKAIECLVALRKGCILEQVTIFHAVYGRLSLLLLWGGHFSY